MSAENERKDFLSDGYMEMLKKTKTLQIEILLRQIGNRYPGSDAEKLRAEARKTLNIDSVHDYNFGIVGQSGVGKSTLINALCGYDINDPRASPIGIVECTSEIKRYPHPSLKHLVFYDLPGAATMNNPQQTYFCDKRLYVFDCLLLVMSERFRQIDLAIAKLAQEMGTPVVFVRNKAMNDLCTMHEKHPHTEEKQLVELTILTIKQNILNELKIAKFENPAVFVIEANSLRNLSKTKFQELDLLEHITSLASERSGLSPNPKAHEEKAASLQGAHPKSEKVEESLAKSMRKDDGSNESKKDDDSGL